MGFPERIEGTGKGMSLFSQWCLMGTGNTQVKILKFRNASESVFPGNLENISSNGVSLSSNSLSSCFLMYTCTRVQDFTNLCSGSQFFDKCMCVVCFMMYAVCAGEDGTHTE